MSKLKLIQVPIFKADIYYSRSSWKELENQLATIYKPGYKVCEYGKDIELEYSGGTTGRVFVVFDNSNTHVDFWFWSAEKADGSIGYCGWVAHEALHLVTEILRQVETPLNSDTEEVYAYLLEFIVSEILNVDWSDE